RHTAADAGLFDLDVEADAFVHLHREGLRAPHAAHSACQDESALQRATEMLPGTCGEGLVRSLDDPLGSDVRPAPRGHLTVHREDGLLPPTLAPQFRSAGGLDPFHSGDDTP